MTSAAPPQPAISETKQLAETCRKVVIRKAGSYDRIEFETVPALEPGPGEVVIQVEATGVNYADCVVRMGLYASAKEFVGWPITPGFEVAGFVGAIGEGVTDLQVGDPVYGVTLFNGYASQVKVARERVFALPEGVSPEEAAGIPAVFLTAYYGLVELAQPRAGQKVLVHSAAGGVGGSLVQLAKVMGCEVTGVVGGSHKVEAAKAFGCDHVIDKSTEDLWALAERYAPDGYDIIADANGVATLGQSYEHLRTPGKLVVYGFHTMMPKSGGRPNWLKLIWGWLRTPRFNPLDMTTSSKSVLAFNLSYMFEEQWLLDEAMERLSGWLAEGKIKPPPVTLYPLEKVADAHRDLESGKTVGKLILVP
jgi:NADPH:quinone reductase-like Zn-dependent oxidoreductase